MKKNNDLQWTNKDISELDKLTDNLLKNNKGIINYISDPNDNLIYSTLYSWHHNTGYYLYGGRKSKKKMIGAAQFLTGKCLNTYQKRKK